MRTLEQPLIAQLPQVTAHGGLRDPEEPGQLRHVRAALGSDMLKYPRLAVASQHWASIVRGGRYEQGPAELVRVSARVRQVLLSPLLLT
ncbi:hypothetical protein GCM10010449_59260 [Streptomyces rectiviolaceus]|uniref:Uncharacterized protein n=1 Tax=Streptomyces rectiviolaceus TaxID=332591 RepID=A0ABP6MYA6_9ACTN